MIKILTSFILVGFICFISSIIYDTTKLTPGHITSLLVVFGTIMAIFGWYDALIDKFGGGLCLPITSFGNSLVNSAYEGFKESGILGIFTGMYVMTSAGIASTIIFSFFMTLFCNPKD